ncbi:hypothetical protein TIFTF001_018490 [Ficus carica]|uniref:Uncharacterized protein n=1 Tax=Ficus carica TaxID=3494 RepID=A0AA88AB60_FICCA|nr:hypothetical protein TIFTF001_018490 [Ficus carica]
MTDSRLTVYFILAIATAFAYVECNSEGMLLFKDLVYNSHSLPRSLTWDLGNAGLSGPLVPELGNLTNLQFLEVFENHINGTIPREIGQLDLKGVGLRVCRWSWIAGSLLELEREGKGEICSHGDRSPCLAVVAEEREADDFIGIAKIAIFSHGGTGVAKNGAWRSRRSCRRRTELGGKIGASDGGSGVVRGGRDKQTEGGERKGGGVWKK